MWLCFASEALLLIAFDNERERWLVNVWARAIFIHRQNKRIFRRARSISTSIWSPKREQEPKPSPTRHNAQLISGAHNDSPQSLKSLEGGEEVDNKRLRNGFLIKPGKIAKSSSRSRLRT